MEQAIGGDERQYGHVEHRLERLMPRQYAISQAKIANATLIWAAIGQCLNSGIGCSRHISDLRAAFTQFYVVHKK